LKHHKKPSRSRLYKEQPKVAAGKSPSRGHVPPRATASRQIGGGCLPAGAKRLISHYLYNYRLVEHPSSPSALRHTDLLE